MLAARSVKTVLTLVLVLIQRINGVQTYECVRYIRDFAELRFCVRKWKRP